MKEWPYYQLYRNKKDSMWVLQTIVCQKIEWFRWNGQNSKKS